MDGGAFFCLQTSSTTSTDPTAGAGMLFGPPAMQPYGFEHNASTHICSPWPMQEPLDSNGQLVQAMLVYLTSHMLTESRVRGWLDYVEKASLNVSGTWASSFMTLMT